MAQPVHRRIRCVVVGGAFGGIACIHHLAATTSQDDLDIVLVEPKDFFEYTPGVLRAMIQPEHQKSLAFSLSELPPRVDHCQGRVASIQPQEQTVSVTRGSERFSLSYDYLVLATGTSSYSEPGIYSQDLRLTDRQNSIQEKARCIAESEKIVIVGAGAVGVELAGEILSRYPSKHVTLVYPRDVLMEFPPRARDMARQWLQDHGCEMLNGIRVDFDSLTTTSEGQSINASNNDTTITGDVILLCLGGSSRPPDYLAGSKDPILKASLSDGKLAVNEHFQLESYPNVFACGDCCIHPSVSTKTAQMANWAGIHIAQHIAGTIHHSSFVARARTACKWPLLLRRAPKTWPSLYVVSLGPSRAILVINEFVLPTTPGSQLASLFKKLIETTKVQESKGSWFGLALWQLGDSAASLMDYLGL
eukprot:TRINITY_DN6688_c0_g2_i2.p1 TRINITY_DN6688_c0_g2~~TRINITY_DN6688_c0_g2_i2.p1  ORF type:complete len:419 (+),score=34.85 TRINITY_DN6688_c0_g2_i2:3-1259(+)